MKKRNVDRIKGLEKELGRYREKNRLAEAADKRAKFIRSAFRIIDGGRL